MVRWYKKTELDKKPFPFDLHCMIFLLFDGYYHLVSLHHVQLIEVRRKQCQYKSNSCPVRHHMFLMFLSKKHVAIAVMIEVG